MGITIGTYGSTGASGWTTVTPSSDTNIIYVSNSIGSDANNGASPSTGVGAVGPVLTLNTAVNNPLKGTLGVGFRPKTPDWILLKKGDTWNNEAFEPFALAQLAVGRSTSEPAVIAGYESTSVTVSTNPTPDPVSSNARPIVQGSSTVLAFTGGGSTTSSTLTPGYLAFMGIDCYAKPRDYTISSAWVYTANFPAALTMQTQFNLLVVENCRFRYYGTMSFDLVDSYPVNPGNYLYFRRNNIFYHYEPTALGHATGFHLSNWNNTVIEENACHHCGWDEVTTLPSTVTVSSVGNTITWGSSNIFPPNNVGVVFANTRNGLLTGSASAQQVVAGQGYIVINASANSFQVMLDGGSTSAVAISSAGVNTATWYYGQRNARNQNFYLDGSCGAVTMRGNYTTMASANGIQGRPGGIMNNNFFDLNPIPGFESGSPSSVTENVIMHNIDGGTGIGTDSLFFNGATIDSNLQNNIFSHKTATPQYPTSILQTGVACQFHSSSSLIQVHEFVGQNNRPFVLTAGVLPTPFISSATVYFTANVVSSGVENFFNASSSPGSSAITFSGGSTSGSFFYAANNCSVINNIFWQFTGSAGPTVLDQGQNNTINPNDVDLSSAGTPHYGSVPYPDPNRDAGTYAGTLGLTATLDGLMAAVLTNCKDNWNVSYTADALNDYIRAGFGVGAASTTVTPDTFPTFYMGQAITWLGG